MTKQFFLAATALVGMTLTAYAPVQGAAAQGAAVAGQPSIQAASPLARLARFTLDETLIVHLRASGDSEAHGIATLTASEEGTAVEVRLEGAPAERTFQVSLIRGTCAEAQESVSLYAIQTDADGAGSETALLNAPLAALREQPMSIVVEAEGESGRLLCGEIASADAEAPSEN